MRDAHFTRGTSHIEKFLKTSQRKEIRAIATERGGSRTFLGRGIQNAFVQLLHIDRDRLEQLRGKLVKICAESKLYSSRFNDAFFPQVETNWTQEEVVPSNRQPIVYIIRAFAYSCIAQSVSFEVSLGNKSFKPVNGQSPNEMETDVDDAVAEEIIIESNADAVQEQQGEQQPDFIMQTRTGKST